MSLQHRLFRIDPLRWFFLTVFVLLAVIYYTWTWNRELGEFGGDSAIYLLTAKHFSPWSGPSDVAAYFANTSQYPPLFPFVLALSGGGESMLVAHLVTTTFLLLAAIVFYIWMQRLGFTALHAGMSVIVFMLLPGVYMEALAIHSENPYLLASLAALLAVVQAEKTGRSAWYWMGALSIASASLTRGVGITLVAAFFVYLAMWRPPRAWLYAIVSVLPIILWSLLHDRQGPGYVDSFFEKYSEIPFDQLLARLGVELNALWFGWVANFSVSDVAIPVMGVIGAICLTGMFHRLWQRKLDGFYASAYLLLILIWPFPGEAKRFMYAIVPVLFAQGLLLAGMFFRGRRVFHWLDARITMLLCILIVAMPALVLTASRFFHPLPDELAESRRSALWYSPVPGEALNNVIFDKLLVDHLRSIPDVVPKGACIYSIKPSIVGLFADRVSLIPPRPQLDQPAFAAYLQKTGCRFFYLAGFASPSFPEEYYPWSRLRTSLKVLSVVRAGNRSGYPVGVVAELLQH